MDERIVTYMTRVDAVEDRLTRLARPLPGLTEADPSSGDRWEAAQVWGHLTEFVPYWIEQIEEVLDDYRGEPVPFGRTSADPDRLAGIEAGPSMPVERHLHWLGEHFADLRGFLTALPEGGWSAEGLHSVFGPMNLERMLEAFLLAHLEQHATQLEKLGGPQIPIGPGRSTRKLGPVASTTVEARPAGQRPGK